MDAFDPPDRVGWSWWRAAVGAAVESACGMQDDAGRSRDDLAMPRRIFDCRTAGTFHGISGEDMLKAMNEERT